MNPPIRLASSVKDIRKQDLQKIVEHFIHLNQSSVQRIQSFLLPKQRIFLDLLPLLFHQNHPLLPGFISSKTVAGISNYTPGHTTLVQASLFAANYHYKHRSLSNYPIEGIYLMGSVSSLAFNQYSDIDIWLCHAHNLSADTIDKLQSKATAVEKWAESLALEVHFFLVDSQADFKGTPAPLSADNKQQTHYLLLEEFYRTALYIAGRTPVWWVVPPHEERNYTRYVQHLKEKRLISAHKTIDFGGLEDIPAEEFVTATLWQLYKSLNSPYKSLLKLLLMECYASEFPSPEWLCLQAKQAIYQGDFELSDIDPYVLAYHKIEQYLSTKNDPERLNFARQCFYFKIMGDINQQLDPQKLALRVSIITQLSIHYQWPEQLLASLIENKPWDIKKASQENDIIMRQLKICYQMISHFSNNNASLSKNQYLQPIGRKLKFFLQKRPGKIDIITTCSSVHSKESALTLVESTHASQRPTWNLLIGTLSKCHSTSATPFKQGARSLVELLAWLVSNGLYQENLNLTIHATAQPISKSDISHALKIISAFLFNINLENLTTLQAFRRPSRIIAHLLLVNLVDTAPSVNFKNGRLVFNDYSDILSYGSKKESFVHTIDQISISSWGEVTCNRYLSLEGLFDCFITCFNQHSQSLPTKVECYTPTHGESIAVGVKNLFIKLSDLFSQQQNQGSSRLIISGESAFYIFQQKESFLHYRKVPDLEALSLELAEAQISFNTVLFNNATLSDTPLPFIFSFAQPNAIHVFCYSRDNHTKLYIIDEKGSLFCQHYINTSSQQLITAYSNFLETLYDKGILEATLIIEYYALFYSEKECYSVTKMTPPPAFTWDYLNIRLTGEIYGAPPEILYSVYCDELEFSPTTKGEDIFHTAANYIYDMRQSKEKYPIHITEIDVPLEVLGVNNYQQLQTVHFLRYKQKIENRLNAT